ncbi:MAG: 50S ribosomal protein L44e [Candidatus Diapherotrites archaeon]
MNVPKEKKLYCKKCKKHTSHKMKLFKSGSPRKMAKGTRSNIRKHKKGYGGRAKFIATVKKQNKKPTFLCECTDCKAKCYYVIPKRMKKIEITAKA